MNLNFLSGWSRLYRLSRQRGAPWRDMQWGKTDTIDAQRITQYLRNGYIYQNNPLTVKGLLIVNWCGNRKLQADGIRLLPHGSLVVLALNPVPFEQRCYKTEQLYSRYYFDDLEKREPTLEQGFRRRSARHLSYLHHNSNANEIQRYYPRIQ